MNWKKGKDNYYNVGENSPSFRNRDPKKEYKYQNAQNLEKSGTESGSGEMFFIDPNDDNYRHNQAMSPITGGRQTMMKSPPRNVLGQSIFSTVRNDLNDRDTSQNMGKKPIPSLKVNLPSKYEERLERSPKTINMGESEKEIEYNIKTLQARRSPKNNNMYINQNEPGNIFLDPPMQSGSFIQGDQVNYQSPTDSQMKGKPGFFQGNSREIQYSMNPRDSRDPMPNILSKMSPNKNIDDESSTDNKGGYDSQTQLRDFKRQIDKDSIMVHNDGDGMMDRSHPHRNEIDRVEEYLKSKEQRNTMTEGDIKKLMKQITKGYDPRKGTEGRLINTTQTIMHKGNDEIFNDRYRVLQKMNKLSTILLSTKDANSNAAGNSSMTIDGKRKTFDRNTLNASTLGTKDRKVLAAKTPQQKFLFISLAMLSSKGPNCEDRIILRKMRDEKGGVVDLAQDQRNKTKYSVKKLQKKIPASGARQAIMYNPKHREKAAKVVQGWWREMKERYSKLLDKIVLIQSIWRGRWLRKYIYDIIYISYLHQRFCDILEKVMVSHIRPQVWDDLFGDKKNAKAALAKLLMKDGRWTYLRLKPFFDRWREAAKFLKNRNLKSKNLVSLRGGNEEKKTKLAKYFNDWLLRANLAKYIGRTKDAEARKQQFFGVLHMINGATDLAKRKGIEMTKVPLEKYLTDKMRSRAVRGLLMKKPKYSLLLLRKYFNKWNQNVLKITMRDLRDGIFTSMATRLNSRLMRNNLRLCFNNWRNKLPKDVASRYMRGKDLLERFANRRTHKDPIKAIQEKEEYLNSKDHLLRLLGVKSRYIREHWRDYFYKWRNQAQRMKDKELKNKMYNTLLNTVLSKRKNRILSNRFSHWRKTPMLDLNHLFDKYKGFIAATEKLCQGIIHPTKQEFLEKAKKTISSRAYKLAIQRLLDCYINQDRTHLRYYTYRWREQCKNMEIYDLKVQLFKYLCGVKESRTRKGMLSKAFNKWKTNAVGDRILKSAKKTYAINQGLEKINMLHKRRPMDFIIRLHKMMNKDYRPKYIESLVNRLFKPRATVKDCFNKWRRDNDINNSNMKLNNLKGKVLQSNAHRLHDRMTRDSLLKAFFKWLNLCRDPEDYYPKISKGMDKLNHVLKKNQLTDPLNTLKSSKNYARRIIPCLKNNTKLQQRLNNDSLKSRFNKWKDAVSSDRIRDLKSNIILKTKNNVLTSNKGKIMTKFFTRWKMYRPKGFNAGFFKGLELLRSFCEKPYRRSVLDAFNNKMADILKRRGLNTLLGASKTYVNHVKLKALRKWWINSKLTDPNKPNRLKARLRIYLKDKERAPLDKYFKKWLRALVKNPDLIPVLNGTDKLKSYAIKLNRPAFDAIKNNLSKDYVNKKIISKLLPNSKLAKNRVLRSYFDKWRSNANKIKVQALKGGLLSSVYTKGKGAVRNRALRTAFKKWATKEPERKPIDLYLAIQAMDKINTMLAQKYLVGFLPRMKEFSTKKFLKSVLMKCSKYHLRALKPFFDKWRNNAIKLQTKNLSQNVSSRLMAQSKTHQNDMKTTKLLTDKLSQWRLNAKNQTRKIKRGIPDAMKYLKMFNLTNNLPIMLDGMKGNALRNKQTKALRSLPPKRAKCDNNVLKKYFNQLRSNVHKMKFNEMKDLLKRKYLGQILKRMSGGLLRYFLIWKNKSQIKHSDAPVLMGANLFRLAIIKDPYRHFVKIADMMNLTIPRGLGVKTALVNRQPNIAKSIALRNWAIRPVWNTWKEKANAIKYKSQNRHFFNKIMMDQLKGGDRLLLRRAFIQWKDQMRKMVSNEKMKELQIKLMGQLYEKNSKIFLKRYFDRWMKNANISAGKLSSINKGMEKLKSHANRPVIGQMRTLIARQAKFNRVKAVLINNLRKNDRDNLAYCFNKWKKNSNKLKEMYLKAILLRNLSSKQDKKSDDYAKNRLHEALLRWRIRAVPMDYLQRLERIRKGTTILKSSLRKPHEREILDGINDRANKRYAKACLDKLLCSIDPKFNERLLRNAIRNWHSKIGDTIRMKNKCSSMLNRYLLSDPMHEKMIHEPEQDIIQSMDAYYQLKCKNAKTITSFCRGLLNIKRQFDIIKRNQFLHKQIQEKGLALLSKYNILFKKWVRVNRHMKTNDDAEIIQRFLKNKMNNPSDKRKRILRGATFLDRYVKRVSLGKIADEARDNLMKKVLKRHIDTQENYNSKVLKDRFTQWNNLLPYLRKEDAARSIQNNYLNLRSRRKVDHMKQLNAKMKYIVLRCFGKYVDKRNIAFNKWLAETQATKCNTNASIIQKYVSERLRLLLKARAMAKLHDMFRMDVLKQLHTLMAKASKITGDKGAVMFNTLEDIYIRRPYEKLIDGMTWIGRIAQLKKIQPKIHETLRKYFLPFAMKKWSNNTWGDKLNKIKKLQEWSKRQMGILKTFRKDKRENLLSKFLSRRAKEDEMKLLIPFKIWDKKTKYDALNDKALTVQKAWKGKSSRKVTDKKLNQSRLNKLFTQAIKTQIADIINDANQFAAPLRNNLSQFQSQFENRYGTNNLIDYSNDLLRNKYLYLLTGKRAYFDGLSDLRRKFDKWRRINRISQDAITKLQNAYRAKMAKQQRRQLELLKDRLLHFMMHCIDSDQNRLHSAFRRWNLRAKMDKCNEMSTVIQDYLGPKLEKLLNKKFQNLFTGLAQKLAKRRMNEGAKVNTLKNALVNINMKTFLQRLSNKDRADRLRFLFARKFYMLDDQLLKMYLSKYMNHWKDQAEKLTVKLNEAALLVQRNFKQHLAKLFLAKLRNRQARILKMMMRLINDKDLQKEIAFKLWRTNAQAIKLDESSRVIQDFMDDIKKKMAFKKKHLRDMKIKEGLERLCNLKSIMREPFNKIRSESNRVIFTKMNDSLINKRKDHLQTALDAIKEEEKDFLLNRLFKIPTSIRHRILHKAINIWNDNAKKIARKQGAEMIQKNYRLYMNRMQQNKRYKNLNELMAHLTLKYSDLLRYYYNKWQKNAKKTTVLRAGNKINRFIGNKFQETKAKKNWNKLTDLLNLRDRNYGALDLMHRLKMYKACRYLIKPIEYRIKEDGYNQLVDQIRRKKLADKMQLIFNNFERRKEILSMMHYLNHWNNQARKLKLRDEALTNAMYHIDNRKNIIRAEIIGSACLIAKLFRSIPKIRAIDFYDRLKRNAQAKKQLEDLGKSLADCRDANIESNKAGIIDKVYKLYIYRIMKKMFDGTNEYIMKTVKPNAQRDFLARLGEIVQGKSNFNYNESRQGTSCTPKTSLSFRTRVTNPKNTYLNSDKDYDGLKLKRLLPYFVDYLEKKVKARKNEALNAVRADYIAEKFCSLYKAHSDKKLFAPKKELVEALVKDSHYKDTLGERQASLFQLFRKGYIQHMKSGLEKPAKMYKLMYCVRMTVMHKKLARQRFVREVVRKWRFLSFVKKMARKKLELMYKNLHVSYLQMANEVFGDDDEVNPSVVKEFERFGANVGMFSNEDPSKGEELVKKYYKTVQKKYVYESVVLPEKEEEKPEAEEIVEIEENSDFYIDQEYIEGTTGKYRGDTNKSGKKESTIKKP